MVPAKDDLGAFVIGDTMPAIVYTYSEDDGTTPVDVSDWQFAMQVRETPTSKHVVLAYSTQTSTITVNQNVVTLAEREPEATDKIKPGTYVYSLKVRDSEGKYITEISGSITFEKHSTE